MNQPGKANILWLCTDQQRFDTIGALGNSHVSTPNIDRLLEGGVAFTRAYCQSPICTPSRASFLTGLYPSRVRVNRNGNPEFPDSIPLVTKLLADAGYDCGLIGKLHLTSAQGQTERRADDGYRYWQYSHAPRDDWATGHDYAEWVRSKGFELDDLNQSMDGVPAELHQTTWCAEKTIEFISQEREGPWLASVNFYDPHPPFNPPKAYRDSFDPEQLPGPLFQDSDLAHQQRLAALDFQSSAAHPDRLDIESPVIPQPPGQSASATGGARDARTLKAAYYAMIALIDDQVGRILDYLEQSGQRDNTVIIFTSDHGETLGDHGLILKGCRFYEGLVRVPLIIAADQFVSGLRSDALVELIDIAPTLIDIAGEVIPAHMQGRSLLPILSGVAAADQHRDFVRCEYIDALDLPDGSIATMYSDGRYKISLYHGHDLGELYDLKADPGEFKDLWDDRSYTDIKLRLMQQSFDAAMLAMDTGLARVGPI